VGSEMCIRDRFSTYLMLRYGSCVTGSEDLQAWYLRATNERVNLNFFDVSATQHKKLQWLLCTTVSPDLGKVNHYWLPAKKADGNNKKIKFLSNLYPAMKDNDIESLAELNSTNDLKDLAREHGWDEKRIRTEL
jgi:hypothetical protein